MKITVGGGLKSSHLVEWDVSQSIVFVFMNFYWLLRFEHIGQETSKCLFTIMNTNHKF